MKNKRCSKRAGLSLPPPLPIMVKCMGSLEVDHIIPKGGAGSQVLCTKCNKAKGSIAVIDYTNTRELKKPGPARMALEEQLFWSRECLAAW